MTHSAHALLVLSTAILLIGGGIVVLGLGWRRRVRGESSAMVVGQLSTRQTALSFLAVPVAGVAVLAALASVAAVLR